MFRQKLVDGSCPQAAEDRQHLGSWSPAPQNTQQPASGASAIAARTSADLPMPGSPAAITERPRARATSLTELTNISNINSTAKGLTLHYFRIMQRKL